MSRVLFFLTILLLVVNHGHSQPYRIKNYGVEQGLPMATITSIVEDQNGYLWVGMYGGGIAEFDGARFKIISEVDGLLNNLITSLAVDEKNGLWIGSVKGVSRYDGSQFTNFPLKTPSNGYHFFFYQNTVFAYQPNSTLVYSFSENGRPIDLPSYIKDITIVKALSNSSALYILNSANEVLIVKNGEVNQLMLNQKVQDIKLLSKKDVYVLIDRKYYLLKDDTISFNSNFLDDNIIDLNSDDTKWIYKQDTLSLLNSESKITWRYPVKGYPTFYYKDSESNFWVSGLIDGLQKIYKPNFSRINDGLELNGKFITRVLLDTNNNIWVGTLNHGVSVFNNAGSNQHFKFKDDVQNGIREIETDSEGNIVVARFKGLFKVDKSSFKVSWVSDTLKVHRLKRAFGNSFWASLQDGSFGYLNKSSFVKVASMKDVGGWIWDFKYSERHKSIFLVTDNGKLIRFDGVSFNEVPIPRFSNSILLTVGFWNDKIIVGTDGRGIALVSLDSGVQYLSRKEGLSSDMVNFADTDAKGKIWVATLFGLDNITLNTNGSMSSIEHYSREHGLESVKPPHRNAYYFGKNGVNLFGVGDIVYQSIDPKIEVKYFPLHLKSIHVGDSSFSGFTKLTLPHTKKVIRYEFRKISKSMINSYTFQFELNGERITQSDSTSGFLVLGGLSPNKYTIKAKVIQKGKVIEELICDLELVPQFHQTIWFRSLVVFFAIGAIFTGVYFRYKRKLRASKILDEIRLQESNRLRKEIGRDFHDEMGNQLARIINYIGLLKMKNVLDLIILDKAEYSAKYLLNGTKDFIWAIDPMNDNLFNLFIHLRDFGEKFLHEKGIKFEAHYIVFQDVSLNHGTTRQVNLIFKEAFTNAFKHSKASLIVLTFMRLENGYIQIIFVDNGIGINLSQLEDSPDGLTNMKTRSEKINAKLIIENSTPNGLRIQLTFKN